MTTHEPRPRPPRHKLLILDDYTRSSTSLADWSHLTSSSSSSSSSSDLSGSSSSVPSLGLDVLTEPIPPSLLVRTLEPYTLLHLMRERTKLDRSTLEKLPNLQFVTTTGMKNRGIDLEACRDLGIVVSGTDVVESRQANGTVEQTWALILSLTRRIVLEHNNLTRNHHHRQDLVLERDKVSNREEDEREVWQTGVANGLKGKTLGLIGVGRLGSQVAQIGRIFGMRVIGWSQNLTPAKAREVGVELADSLETLLETADVVSLHTVLSSRTEGMLGERELRRMKPTAYLINTSRGPLVNERALVNVLENRKIAGAGLDVFDLEPLPRDHVLRTLDNVVLSPHMGYVENPTYQEWFKQTVENVENFLRGTPIRLL